MSIGIFLVMIQTYLHLRWKFSNINDLRFSEAQDVQELRHEIAVWQRAAASLSSYSKDEDLVRETLEKKCNRLTRTLKKKLTSGSVPIDSYKATLEDLQAKVISFVLFFSLRSLTIVFCFSCSTQFVTKFSLLSPASLSFSSSVSSFSIRRLKFKNCPWDGLPCSVPFCC